MADYQLIYWPIPFRGQFIRATLAHVGATWEETDFDGVIAAKSADVADQASPHMGPPVLTDHQSGFTVSQTHAILAYLGRKYDLIPTDLTLAALTDKIIADANDVLCDMTRNNGSQMWTKADWDAFQPRLQRWMLMFEQMGTRHGLTAENGFLLGGEAPGLADLVTAPLWGVMVRQLPEIRPTLEQTAPILTGLVDRMEALPEQVALRQRSEAAYGQLWCEGQIEASLRAVLSGD